MRPTGAGASCSTKDAPSAIPARSRERARVNPSSPGARDSREAVRRLLQAWRGEIEARAVYAALAARERDPKRAAVLRRMSEAEAGHRARIEARLRDLGAAIPDPRG